jgi:uncharacterized repeat protein (TIGR03833 family)
MCPVCGKPVAKCLCHHKKEIPQSDGIVRVRKETKGRKGEGVRAITDVPLDGQQRSDIRPGMRVEIILKKDQRTGKRTIGIVRDILTSAAFHSRGIKVRLDDGRIGRVQGILSDA